MLCISCFCPHVLQFLFAFIHHLIRSFKNIAQLLILIACGVNFFPAAAQADPNNIDMKIALIVTVLSVFSVVGLLLELIGLKRASEDAKGYKKAFTYCLVALFAAIAFSVLSNILGGSLIPVLLSTVAGNVLQILSAYYAVTTSLKLLAENRADDVVALGTKLWLVFILSALLMLVCSVLTIFESLPVAILMITGGVFGIIRSLAYAVFLAKAYPRV